MNPSTLQGSHLRWSSILKIPKQYVTAHGSDSSIENSPNIKQRRRVSFAEKKHVKEFCNSLEQGTVWNNTYEEHDSSHSNVSNSSNEAQGDLRSCNQGNQIIAQDQITVNSIINKKYSRKCNSEDDGMDFCESFGVPLATDNYENINYADVKNQEQEVCDPHLLMVEYKSNLPNTSTYEEMPIELTQVVRPSSIQPNNYISVCQYIDGLPLQDSISAFRNKIDESSKEFTAPILSTIATAKLASELDKENIIPEYSMSQCIPMEFTAPITVVRDRVAINADMNQEESPLLSNRVLQEVLNVPNYKEAEHTLAFNDSSMEITKAVSVKSFPTTSEFNDNDTEMENSKTQIWCNDDMQMTTAIKGSVKSFPTTSEFNDNNTQMENSKTQIWCNDDMQMTTAIKGHCFISSSESLKGRLNLQEEQEPVAVLEDKTSIFLDNSMTITTAIPPHFRLANDNALLGAANLVSNLVEEVPQDLECSMQFENQSIEITKAVQTPGILASHCMPSVNNCLTDVYNEISTTREPANKSSGVYRDMSMEITSAVNTQRNIFNAWNMDDKENCPTENENPLNINRKSSRKSVANAPITNSIVPNLLLDKENCPTILQNLSCNRMNMFSNSVTYTESNNILNNVNYISEKETPMDSSEIITSHSSHRTDNSNRSDMSMELTSITHIPISLGSRDYMACDAQRNFSETIPVQNLEYNDNQMILADEEKVCISTSALKTHNTTTTDLNITNREPAYAIPKLNSDESPRIKITCSQVATSNTNEANQSCVMLDESEVEHPEEQGNSLETSELFSYSLEDLNSIKPPSFLSIDNVDCNDENVNNVSVNECDSNKEKVSKNECVQITTFVAPPTDSSNSNDNENKAELTSTYQEYTDVGYNYQENNAVRACHSSEFVINDLRRSQAFLIRRKSLGMTSIVIDDEEAKQAIDDQAFHRACADNSVQNPIDCSSILLNRSVNLTQKCTDTTTDVEINSQVTRKSFNNNNEVQPFETSVSVINGSKNDSYTCTIPSEHLNQSINPEVRNRLDEIFDEISVLEKSIKKSVTNNQNLSSKNVEIGEVSMVETYPNEESVLVEEDPFSSLLAQLQNMVKNGSVIWDVYHVNVEKRKLVIGFISSSLLVSILLEDTSVDFVHFQIARLRVVSRLRAADSDILMRIAHRLLLEQINTEAHLRAYKEHHNIFQLLEDITTDVKLVLDFIIDLKRLKQLNLMVISDEQIAFTALTKRAGIILRVIINIKVFSKLDPSDIHIECLLGTIKQEDVRKLIINVKRDHKFLRRYISDVRDYIYLMEN